MNRSASQQTLRLAVMGLSCGALLGCANAELVAPGARGLAPTQSAWIVSDDDVQLVSLDGNPLNSKITFEKNAFEDGVRDKVQVEPGSHVVEVRLDNGRFDVKEPMKLRLDTEAAMTYYVTVTNGPPLGYQVHVYAGMPNQELLKSANNH
jgi:hypothetical protein